MDREWRMFDLRECVDCGEREGIMVIAGDRLCQECADAHVSALMTLPDTSN